MYLFNGGGPGSVGGGAGSTDILISWIYRWQQVHLLNTQWRQLLPWLSLSLSSQSLWSHSRNYTHLIWRTSKMNNSIKLKRRLTQTLTYLYLIGLSIVIIYPLLITIMSAFKAGKRRGLLNSILTSTSILINFKWTLYWNPIRYLVSQHFDYRLNYYGCSNKYYRTCWLCLQPLQFLGS